MTYETFLEKAKKSGADINPYLPFSLDKLWVYPAQKKSKTPVSAPDFVAQYWDERGARGGSCWGTEITEYVGKSTPSSFPDLIKILGAVAPELTFIQYELLKVSGVIKEGSETEYHYYGNYTEYGYRLVVLRELYDELVEMKVIELHED